MPDQKSSQELFKPVIGSRPTEQIILQIRDKLGRQELRTGDKLPSERELSEQFQVSRNTVRQALRSLAESGLLDIRKGASGGAFIQKGGAGAVRNGLSDLYALGAITPDNLTEVRMLLSVEIARLACERCTELELELLEKNVDAAMDAARRRDIAERTRLNLEFNSILARTTRNPLLVAFTDAVMDALMQFVRKIGPVSNQMVMPSRQRLLQHLKNRDSAAAAQEVAEHLNRLQLQYLSSSKKSASREDSAKVERLRNAAET